MHLSLQNSNTTLKMAVFFTIKILEMGVFLIVKNPLKGSLNVIFEPSTRLIMRVTQRGDFTSYVGHRIMQYEL